MTGSSKVEGELSELLKINWFRVIIDEGHILGSLSLTNSQQMSCCIEVFIF